MHSDAEWRQCAVGPNISGVPGFTTINQDPPPPTPTPPNTPYPPPTPAQLGQWRVACNFVYSYLQFTETGHFSTSIPTAVQLQFILVTREVNEALSWCSSPKNFSEGRPLNPTQPSFSITMHLRTDRWLGRSRSGGGPESSVKWSMVLLQAPSIST